jgi:hypothetical protein
VDPGSKKPQSIEVTLLVQALFQYTPTPTAFTFPELGTLWYVVSKLAAKALATIPVIAMAKIAPA